jgi:hypothetical protein
LNFLNQAPAKIDLFFLLYANLSQSLIYIYISGIKAFNHLPQAIKMLAADVTNFKSALKRFLFHHPFYSMKEYYQHNWT